MERIFADFTVQVFAFIRFDLSNQRHPRSIFVKFGIAEADPNSLYARIGKNRDRNDTISVFSFIRVYKRIDQILSPSNS